MEAVTTNAAANAMRRASERTKASSGDICILLPSPGGGGSDRISVANARRGGVISQLGRCWTWRDLHPSPPRVTHASTLPLQGRVNERSHPLHRHRDLRAVLDGLIDHAIAFGELQQQVELVLRRIGSDLEAQADFLEADRGLLVDTERAAKIQIPFGDDRAAFERHFNGGGD